MKIIRPSSARVQRASVLVIAIVFGAITSVVLLSYLELIQARTKVRARSMAWNQAIPILEAGIEEGFTHLQEDTNTLTANSWTMTGAGATAVYKKTRTNSDGSYYIVTLSNAVSAPILAPAIYSQGFVPAPLASGFISRKVQVVATRPRTFSKAISAKGTITMGGNSVVDSFDSSNPLYSTGGKYDPTKRKANGGVVTSSRAKPAISVGTTHIYGQVDTGAGGTVTVGGSGGVGDFGVPKGTIQSGYVNDDFNFGYEDQSPPPGYTGWLNPVAGTYNVNGTNYPYQLTSGNYYQPGPLKMTKGGIIITGNATLYVDGAIALTGTSFIYITPGASLKLYGGGTSTTITGSILNSSGQAANLSYYGMTNNTSVTLSGGSDFIGTINAPEADLKISGGGSIYGALILNSFTAIGGSGVHFDEGLTVQGPFKLASYREL